MELTVTSISGAINIENLVDYFLTESEKNGKSETSNSSSVSFHQSNKLTYFLE